MVFLLLLADRFGLCYSHNIIQHYSHRCEKKFFFSSEEVKKFRWNFEQDCYKA